MIPVLIALVLIAALVLGVLLLERRVERACRMSPTWVEQYRIAQQRKGSA